MTDEGHSDYEHPSSVSLRSTASPHRGKPFINVASVGLMGSFDTRYARLRMTRGVGFALRMTHGARGAERTASPAPRVRKMKKIIVRFYHMAEFGKENFKILSFYFYFQIFHKFLHVKKSKIFEF